MVKIDHGCSQTSTVTFLWLIVCKSLEWSDGSLKRSSYLRILLSMCGPEVWFETCVAMKFVGHDDDDDDENV